MLNVHDLRCEHERTPMGVARELPRFSWKLSSDQTGVVQRSWRIQLADSPDLSAPRWDSDDVGGDESHLVAYGGPPLEPRTRYYFRVRVMDSHGEQSDWSETSWFETAVSPAAWTASFIGMELPAGEETSRPIYLRKEFTVDGKTAVARIYATALGVYELWLNGERVGEEYLAPGWTNYSERLAFQTYDVTDRLKPGANAVAAVVGAGWYSGNITWLKVRSLYGQHAALSLELRATTVDGGTVDLLSDTSWRASYGPILSSEIYHGERYDARLEQAGWNLPGFEGNDWQPAVVREFDRERLMPQEGPPVRKQERLPVREVITTPRGETVLDFGQNLTGWVELTAHGTAGDRVALSHAEVLDAEGNFYTENLRQAQARAEYLLSGGREERLEPHFTFFGFRYVRLDAYPGEVDPASFTAVVLHSDMPKTIDFECSNQLLNQLHHNILWGWKGNTVDIPTDCPQRDERLGWTGDAEVFIGTATYLTQAVGFFTRWLRDVASEQLADGSVPFVVPDALRLASFAEPMFKGGQASTGWGDAAVVCPWTVYQRYGDRELLREEYPSMKAWVEYIRSQAEDGLIWNTGFHFGDWVALDAKEGSYFGATPNDLTATAFYAYSTDLLARAARALGKTEDAAKYAQLHDAIVAAFRNEFVTPSGRIAARTQTAQILSLVFGLVREEHRDRVVGDLVALIDENEGHLTTGFLGTPFICRALADNGRLDRAYELLLRDDYPSWLYQVRQGATTVWEHWDGIKPDGTMWSPDMNSFNHYAYGAVGEWIYATIGGLDGDPEAPGFRSFILRPRPGGGITTSDLSYESPYGTIRLRWRVDGERMSVDASVPPNSSARLVASGVASSEVVPSGNARFEDTPDGASARLGSGEHHFEWRLPLNGTEG